MLCKSPNLKEIINLGMHPMADTFIPPDKLSDADRMYSLICDLCEHCSQIQLRTVTSPEERYMNYHYSYTSDNSAFSRNHWIEYANSVAAKTGLQADDFVVEMGSNDGFLAKEFFRFGCQVLGIDPSTAMAQLALQRNVNTVTSVFSRELATSLERTLPKRPKLIVANNVFNHSNDPLDFASGVKTLLAPDGIFVFELPYWLTSIEARKFDQIYHEHVSYFTVSYAVNLFNTIGMQVYFAEEVEYHGGSIRVYVRHEPLSTNAELDQKSFDSVRRLIDKEADHALFKADTYQVFMQEVLANRNKFLEMIYQLKNAGHSIVCIGAAAKGNTFLNYYNLDSTLIDYVTDASPIKIGKYTPRTRIPIAPDSVVRNYQSVYAVILSWNISLSLQNALKAINPHIIFLSPYEVPHDL
jgi:SAM-dependent methyltransferase